MSISLEEQMAGLLKKMAQNTNTDPTLAAVAVDVLREYRKEHPEPEEPQPTTLEQAMEILRTINNINFLAVLKPNVPVQPYHVMRAQATKLLERYNDLERDWRIEAVKKLHEMIDDLAEMAGDFLGEDDMNDMRDNVDQIYNLIDRLR